MASSALGLIGNYFGGPIGGFIGSTIGQILFAPKPPTTEGPRLSELQVQTSTYGAGIPRLYGTAQLAGNVIWVKGNKIDETRHKQTSGGKGGPPAQTSITYTYSATFAVMIAETEIAGIRKLWGDNALMYDVSTTATAATLQVSNEMAKSITIYSGASDQLVDPLMEADKGSGNAPAYRGRAYIVFEDLQLEKFGNRIPNIRVEAVAAGTISTAKLIAEKTGFGFDGRGKIITSFRNGVYRAWDDSTYTYLFDADGNYLTKEVSGGGAAEDYYPPADAGRSAYRVGRLGEFYVHAQDFVTQLPWPAGSCNLYCYGVGIEPLDTISYDLSIYLDQTLYFAGASVSPDGKRLMVLQCSSDPVVDISGTTLWTMFDDNLDVIDTGTIDFGLAKGGSLSLYGFGLSRYAYSAIGGCNMLENDYNHIWSSRSSGDVHCMEIGTDNVLSVLFYDDTLQPTSGWTGEHCIYADDGIMTAIGYRQTDNRMAAYSRNGIITDSAATLSTIVSDICDKAGATSYNVSALTDSVDGYLIPRPTSARSAIEPLMTAFFFDAVESDDVIKFVKRGAASAASIPEIDLGASEGDSAPLLEITRKQDLELPLEVNVQYLSQDSEYETNNQRSRRTTVNAIEKVSLQLPVVMSDNKAKQVAEVTHFAEWQRNTYRFTAPPEYEKIEPTDVITVTADGVSHVVRVTGRDAAPGGMIAFEAVQERPDIYTFTATGASSGYAAEALSHIGPTKSYLLDIPMLNNNGNTQSFYAAATGYFAAWKGATLNRSTDLGASYSQVEAITNGVVAGEATDALGDCRPWLWDRANTVNVRLISGTLASDTEANVLAGANVAVIGTHGAWEIIQWVTATLEADGTYTLSNLLRARLGTEAHTGGHAIGDAFIVLDSADIYDIQGVLNTERYYRAVSIGTYLDDAYEFTFTNTGVRLTPYAPYKLESVRNGSGDIALSWLRRSRFSSAAFWSPQLGEDSESYEIDIMNGSTVVRTITASTESATYTAAQQTTDFGSTQSSVTIRLYQLSATVGRGNVLEVAA